MKKKNIIIIIILLLSIIIAKTYSKYLLEQKDTHAITSTSFYLESNLLDKGLNKNYVLNNWDGITNQIINFDVRNYTSNLLYSKENIEYTIKAEALDDVDNVLTLIVQDELENSVATTEILQGNKIDSKRYRLKIISNSQVEKGKTFNIRLSINSISPYTKELIANFELTTNETQDYEANLNTANNDEYITLNLKINKLQDMVIKYDNTKLILDKSKYLLNNIAIVEDTMNSFNISNTQLEKNKNYEINFIKINTSDQINLGTDIIIE